MSYILAIDQGTTSSRAIIYDSQCHPIAVAQQEFTQHFPKPGWVEHDAAEIWNTVVATVRQVIQKAGISPSEILCAGITNQRETVVMWDRKTGEPVHRAIVWQDRRTSEHMAELRETGHEGMIQKKTGLILDSYFSASKISWIFAFHPELRQRAEAGELAAGTIDSWLVYKLTGGTVHATDVTNASRTMLMNLHTTEWDEELLDLFKIPRSVLPDIRPTSYKFGVCDPSLFGAEIPICSIVGDQQGALFGQLCAEPGLVKCTYGTGCFMLMMLGPEPVPSESRLLTTVAWKIGDEPVQYALEGSIFVGGAAIQWLRDGLKIIKTAPEINTLAAEVPDSGGVVLVPAFTGLGAPYWDSSARGTLLGLTRGTTGAHIARATLEGIAYQVADLLGAMEADSGRRISIMRVDGGAAASDLLMQIQADSLGVTVDRPRNVETTALGAAFLAGLAAGVWKDTAELAKTREVDSVFKSQITLKDRRAKLKTWRTAVKRARGWETK